MRDSFFLKRILTLLVITLIFWAFITNILYALVSRPLLVRSRGQDLLPQAAWIAEKSGYSFITTDPLVENLVAVSYNFFSVWTMVYYADGRSLQTTLPDSLSAASKESLQEQTYALHQRLLAQNPPEENYGTLKLEGSKGEFLYVYAPIYSSLLSERSNRPIGTVIIIQPLEDFKLSIESLNIALFIASLLSGILLILPATILGKKLMRPMKEIQEVTLAVAQGDFSQHIQVDPYRHDEVSDLANAVNHMTDTIARSMQELSLERNQLKEIVQGISEGIIAVDRYGRITQINDLLWSLFQLDPDDYSAQDLLKETGIDLLFHEVLEKETTIKKEIRLEDSKRIIYCTVNPIFDHHLNLSAAVGLFRDITKSTRLEQTRREYIANISHELRSPLTGLQALIEPLNDGLVKKEEDRQRYYQIIYKETLRLSRLINDMLELSRLQSGTGYIEQGPLDLEVVFSDLAEKFQFICSQKQIEFEVERPQERLPMIWGNSDRIGQILMTYMDNAMKFTSTGGHIIFRINPDQDRCYIEVQDNGPGIKAEDIPYVFERFYKADKSHNSSGTGLGLSIAKALAENLDMTVSVKSAEGSGACFILGVLYASEVMRREPNMKDVYDDMEEAEPHEDK